MLWVLAFLLCSPSVYPPFQSSWTIHGLWPPESFPCTHTNLTRGDLGNLIPTLEEVWPTCEHGPHQTDFRFWSHEWWKHGSCTGWTPYDYFNRTILLYEEYLPKVRNTCGGTSLDRQCKLSIPPPSFIERCPYK